MPHGVAHAVGDGVFGREDELELVERVLAGGALPALLVIEGAAGIGKTTLWRHAVEVAASRQRVLACTPAEAETELAFAGLADLLGDVLPEAVEVLPAPQARALEVALRRVEGGDRPPDPFAIHAAFLGTLRALARDGPVLVAVDDVQWLDRPSELALSFAVRRLGDEPVSLVVARRSEPSARLPLGLDRLPPGGEPVRLDVRPLSLGAIHRLLRERLDLTIGRPLLRRIHDASGGNPFYALELGRELRRRGSELAPDEPLPLPDLALRSRLDGLGARTRDVLLAAASASHPSRALLEAIHGPRAVCSAIDEAVAAGVLEPEARRIRFVHPLLASAAYAHAPPDARRRAHRALARVVEDSGERARQLALAASGRDGPLASALRTAAQHAEERGAPETARELAELALSRAPEAWGPRLETQLAAGRYALSSGDRRRAAAHFRAALRAAEPGRRRAEALVCLAEAEQETAAAIELCEEALVQPATPDRLRCRAQQWLARACHLHGLGQRSLQHAREALELAEACGDRDLLVGALTEAAELEWMHGHVEAGRSSIRRAVALEPEGYARLRESPRLSLARVLAFRDLALEEARALLTEVLVEAEARGDERARRRVLWNLAVVHYDAGSFDECHRYASAGLEAAEVDESDVLPFLVWRSRSAALLGRVDEARATADRAQSLASATVRTHLVYVSHGLGLLELSLGRLEPAAEHLAAAASRWRVGGSPADGDALHLLADRVEVLVALGESGAAGDALAELEAMSRDEPFPVQAALALRCRALVAAGDDLPAALETFAEAMREHGRASKPFERARTLLLYGRALRRAKRRGDARRVLEEAHAEFERMSAPLWAAKARAELARVGGRTRTGALTDAERRLAALVAEGRSNKEVAAALFVTPKTVSTQLSRIYAKLGIHSRAELVRRVLEESKV